MVRAEAAGGSMDRGRQWKLNLSSHERVSKMKTRMAFFSGVVMAFLLVVPLAEAAELGRIRMGKMVIVPEATYETGYSSNITFDKNNKESDWRHRFGLGVRAEYGDTNPTFHTRVGKFAVSKNRMEAGYDFSYEVYTDNDQYNYAEHHPYASVSYQAPIGLYVKADESFLKTADLYGIDEFRGRDGGNIDRWTNRAGVEVGYVHKQKYTIRTTYVNYLQRFDDREYQWKDRIDHQFGVALGSRITPKLSAFGEYRFTTAEYDEQNDGVNGWNSDNAQDYDLHEYFAGIAFDPTRKLRGEIKLGYGERDFDHRADRFGDAYSDTHTWVAETALFYTPRASTTVFLSAHRGFKGSPDQDSSSYVDTTMGIGASQNLGRRVTLDGDFYWSFLNHEDEPGADRKYFHVYRARIGVDYLIFRWWRVGLEYAYSRKVANNSAFNDEEYEVNDLGLNTHIVWNF